MSTMTTGRLGRYARLDHLVEIECPDAKLFERRRISDTKAGQHQQQRHAQGSREAKSLR